MAHKKAYVVFVGRVPGIYETWDECKLQVEGFHKARYRGYLTYDEAVEKWEAFEALGNIDSKPSKDSDVETIRRWIISRVSKMKEPSLRQLHQNL